MVDEGNVGRGREVESRGDAGGGDSKSSPWYELKMVLRHACEKLEDGLECGKNRVEHGVFSTPSIILYTQMFTSKKKKKWGGRERRQTK